MVGSIVLTPTVRRDRRKQGTGRVDPACGDGPEMTRQKESPSAIPQWDRGGAFFSEKQPSYCTTWTLSDV